MTVFRRGNRWVTKVWRNGCWNWVGTYPTKREARRAEAQAKPIRLGPSTTVAEFAERWLRDYARPSAATQRSYRYAVRHFIADFGRRRLDAIDRPTARAWAQANRQSNTRVVRAMYSDALRDGLVAANPFSGLRLGKPRGRKDLDALTEDQIDELAAKATETLDPEVGPVLSAMILVAGYCGLRPGELFGLEWRDIHADELTVARSIDTTGQEKLPKNGKPRTVLIPPRAREGLALIPRRVDVPWVFTTPRGSRFSKSSLRYWFMQVRVAWGQPEFEFYALRHACATMLMERGADVADIAQHLGHSDHGRLVAELYGHPREAGSRERLRRVFGENISELVATKSQAGEESA